MTEEKTLEEFLHDLLEKEKERHEQLLKEHEELMRMIDEARKGMHKNDYLWKCKKKVCEVSRDVYLRFKLRRVIKELMAETEV